MQLVLVQPVHLIVGMVEGWEVNLLKLDVMMQIISKVMVAIIVKLNHIMSVQYQLME